MSNEFRPIAVSRLVRGWVNYFKLADMRGLLRDVDTWLRRRIRMVYWKQWKKVRTKMRMLQRLGIEKGKAFEFACTRKSYWRTAKSPILHTTLTIERLRRKGYQFFLEYYDEVRVS